jgi:RNA polymerase-binding transcription factor DksA
VPDDGPDRAADFGEERLIARLDDEARGELTAIRSALRRLEIGTFGVCTRCGGPIALGRLRALPWAPTCVDCAG